LLGIYLQMVQIVCTCARVGYVPKRAEELVQLASGVYHRLIAKQNYRSALLFLYALTNLQLFLDRELLKLFTLETLEGLDVYMAGSSTCYDNCVSMIACPICFTVRLVTELA